MAINKYIKEKDKEKIVFVIMPFEDWFHIYYDKIYIKAIEKTKLTPKILANSVGPKVLVQEMFDLTKKAEVILADLTRNNANVCYELGLAHALNKPAILIIDSTETIPFDVTAFRVIKYDKNFPDWGDKLKQDIISSLEEIIKNPKDFKPVKLLSQESSEENNDESLELIRLSQINDLERQHVLNERIHNLDTRIEHRRHLSIGPPEALLLLHDFLKTKKSSNYIINRLTSLGAPRHWIINKIREETKRKK